MKRVLDEFRYISGGYFEINMHYRKTGNDDGSSSMIPLQCHKLLFASFFAPQSWLWTGPGGKLPG